MCYAGPSFSFKFKDPNLRRVGDAIVRVSSTGLLRARAPSMFSREVSESLSESFSVERIRSWRKKLRSAFSISETWRSVSDREGSFILNGREREREIWRTNMKMILYQSDQMPSSGKSNAAPFPLSSRAQLCTVHCILTY